MSAGIRIAVRLLGRSRRQAVVFLLFLGAALGAFGRHGANRQAQGGSSLMALLKQEIERAAQALGKADPAAYFISYSAHDQETTALEASVGALMSSRTGRTCTVDVVVRVGDKNLDNTHGTASSIQSDLLPSDDSGDAVTRTLWRLTNSSYRRAATDYLKVKARLAVRAEEEDQSPDFSEECPQIRAEASPPAVTPEMKAWEERLRRYSAAFRKYPDVYASRVLVLSDRVQSTFVSSEGTALAQPGRLARIVIEAETRAPDGMELTRGEVLQSNSSDRLPADLEVLARVEQMAADLTALRAAPVAEPFDGPALLSGEAAAVFFHEVVGHRLEGNRQRSDEEGQTFTKKVNQQILPEFLSIVSDPTLREWNGTALTGAYDFDDEGVPASRVDLVENGLLKNFLMSRMPIRNFNHSNGHGRAQPGRTPIARQSNLIVISSKAVSDSGLRQKLIDEVRRQGKPYGLYFENMLGGFTITQRSSPQAFQLLPVMVWRVYADGRPDELIRGVDVVGTPLAALRNIVVTGQKVSVFNGMCGAESGYVPVSAAAPAMLLSNIEVQKRAQSRVRPPVLPPPGFETRPAAAVTTGSGAPEARP